MSAADTGPDGQDAAPSEAATPAAESLPGLGAEAPPAAAGGEGNGGAGPAAAAQKSLTIGAVCKALQSEFPDISISK
ncbi:MAG: hypothetical protein AVDCRST_MAG38-2904, partial [uncultured Solirubrobacteraceae bacterium]